MKATKLLLAAAVAAASLGALANEQEGSSRAEPFQSSVTSAQVRADLAAYRQARVNPWSTSYNQLAQFNSARSRAEVRAEYMAARDQVAALTGEDSGSAYLTRTAARGLDTGTNLAGQARNTAE